MKVFFKEPGKKLRQMNVPNELHVLQDLVGGYVESVTLFMDMAILCNEEGRLNGMKYNCEVCGINFYGPIVFVCVDGEEFCDVPYDGSVVEFVMR